MYREKNGDTYYTIPGGRMELNETPEETVVRELMEETSINVKPVKFQGVYENNYAGKPSHQHLYICDYISGEPQLGDAIEKEIMTADPTKVYIPKWIPLNEVEGFTIHPDGVEAVFKSFIRDQTKSQ